MTPKQLLRRVKIFLWGLVVLAFLCIFLLRIPVLGLFLGVVALALSGLVKLKIVQVLLTRIFLRDEPVPKDERSPKPVREPERKTTSSMPEASALSEEEIGPLLDQEAQPAIMLKRAWPVGAAAPQNSWLGGLPRLRDGQEWPINPDTGLALHHLAQIDLSEMPQIDVPHSLPERGMLWFFADVSEDMDWQVGPDMSAARVIYHPDSADDQPLRDVPRHLPEVDHSADEMEKSSYVTRSAPIRVYPRWPITGHPTLTWDQDSLPEGVEWGSGYEKATAERMEAERAAVMGPTPETGRSAPGPFRFEIDAGGQSRQVYDPMQAGKMYPYHHAMAAEIIREMRYQVVCRRDWDAVTVRNYPDRLKEIKKKYQSIEQYKDKMSDYDERLDQHHKFAAGVEERYLRAKSFVDGSNEMLAELDVLFQALTRETMTDPLSQSLQETFDRILEDYCLSRLKAHDSEKIVSRGKLRMLQRSIDEPQLMSGLPDGYFDGMIKNFSSFSHYSKHYLLGAKGVSSNATAGKGVRLAQFDTDYAMDFMFCDCGIIDFWIDPDDLANGRWDRAWAATAGG